MRTKIVHVISGLGRGGAETFLTRLMDFLRDMDHHVIALSPPPPSNVLDQMVQWAASVTILDLKNHFIRDFWALRRHIQRVNPHVIQGWMYHGNVAASLASLGLGVPLFWNVRNGPMDGSQLGRLPFKSMTHGVVKVGSILSDHGPQSIIYNAESAARLHESWGYDGTKTIVIPNGIDGTVFKPDLKACQDRRRNWDIPQGGIVIGWVGRDHPQKDIPGFLTALSETMAHNPAVYGVMCGAGLTADHPTIAPFLVDASVRGRLRLLGPQLHMNGVYPGFDFLCSSAAFGEAFPNVILEAMACGVPCIATDVGDSRVLIDHWGWIAPPADPHGLGVVMRKALKNMDKIPSDQIRNHILHHYDLTAIAQRYGQLYGDATGRA